MGSGSDGDFTLLELLDRLIDKGVAASGDLTLSVAEVNLVYVGVRLLLASADEVEGPARPGAGAASGPLTPAARPGPGAAGEPAARPERALAPPGPALAPGPAAAQSGQPEGDGSAGRIDLSPNDLEKGLCQLVLTVVDLLRQLMERQALRRMERGSLTEEEVERLGRAFERLEQRMVDLKRTFDLTDEDLNIDLGPLGRLR